MEENMDSDDSNSDYRLGGRKKWVSVEIPENFDPNKVPSNGEEYLQHVMYEARNCQTVMTVDIDPSKIKPITAVAYNPPMDCAKSSKSLLPSQVWQNEILTNYTDFRNYLIPKLPKLHDAPNRAHLRWIDKMDHEPPKTSEVTSLSTATQVRLLGLIIQKLEEIKPGDTLPHPLGAWIHGILSVLQTPLSPNMCSVIRELARKCALIRSKLPEGTAKERCANLNYFICVIALYYKQFDLADKTD